MDFHNLSLQKKQKDCAKPCKAYRKYNPLVANYLLKKKNTLHQKENYSSSHRDAHPSSSLPPLFHCSFPSYFINLHKWNVLSLIRNTGAKGYKRRKMVTLVHAHHAYPTILVLSFVWPYLCPAFAFLATFISNHTKHRMWSSWRQRGKKDLKQCFESPWKCTAICFL